MDQQMLFTVKRALLHELDTALQRSCHQSLQDVLTDLRIRCANVGPDPTPDEVVELLLRNDILALRPAPRLLRLRASLDRWHRGSLGLCERCGTEILPPDLERDPMRTRCRACEHA